MNYLCPSIFSLYIKRLLALFLRGLSSEKKGSFFLQMTCILSPFRRKNFEYNTTGNKLLMTGVESTHYHWKCMPLILPCRHLHALGIEFQFKRNAWNLFLLSLREKQQTIFIRAQRKSLLAYSRVLYMIYFFKRLFLTPLRPSVKLLVKISLWQGWGLRGQSQTKNVLNTS